MANSFTNLVNTAYKEFDVVSRELTGAINSVTFDAQAAAIPVGQTLYSAQTPAATIGDITPGVTPPDDGDQTIASTSLTISKAKRAPFRWTGEEEKAVSTGIGMSAIQTGQINNAIRSIVNAMEVDICTNIILGASRAYGTAGTTPFASTLADASNLRKILDDNGAPGNRSYVINTTAGVNLRNLTQLTKANEAGTSMTLRDGELLDLFGLSIKESAGIQTTTAGTGTSYQTNHATYPIGTTSIAVDTGSGTVVAGDVVTFTGDTNKYVVVSSTGGGTVTNVVIAAPGLRKTLADNVAMTIGAAYTGNFAFSQNAFVFAARVPYFGPGDLAERTGEVEIITDPRTNISLRLAMYPNYGRAQYEVSAAWGWMVTKPEHIVLSLG